MFVRILGIDPGLTRCGYALINYQDSKAPKLEFNGVLSTPKDKAASQRLNELHHDLVLLFEDLKPDVVAIEKVFFQNNASTAMGIAQVTGMVHSIAATFGIGVSEYTPTQIKSAITSDGKADKIQIQTMVMRMLNLRQVPQPADAADAVAIALTHSLFLNVEADEKNSDESIYNGSKLQNAIANAISSQNEIKQKEVTNSVRKNMVRRKKPEKNVEREIKKEGLFR